MNWHDFFIYDCGNLIRKPRTNIRSYRDSAWNKKWAGKVAGSIRNDGYIEITLNDKSYLAHRIVLEMHNGKIPEGMQIDHINHDRIDNRIENIRLVSANENGKNQSYCKANKSGFNGVSWHSVAKKWRARLKVEGKEIHIGLFDSPELASMAIEREKINRGFHENHGKKKA